MKPLSKSCSLHLNKLVCAHNTHSIRVAGVADRGRHREVVDSGHLHNDYLFSGMQQKTEPRRSKREHRKLISMRFRPRQRVRCLGETEQKWESGYGKRHVTVHSIKLLTFPPHLHALHHSVYALLFVCVKHVCVSVRPYIFNHVT